MEAYRVKVRIEAFQDTLGFAAYKDNVGTPSEFMNCDQGEMRRRVELAAHVAQMILLGVVKVTLDAG